VHPEWIIPEWPAPAGVRAVCTTRVGGQSQPPYDSLNLGDHVGDAALHVASNRAQLQQAMGARTVFLQQVHGQEVVELDADTADGTVADAAYTRQLALACTVMVADCLPLLWTDTRGSVVAAAHAGWRGLAGRQGRGVIEALFAALQCPADELLVWLGPCIGPQAFEVGSEVKVAFEASQPGAAACFAPLGGGQWLADLPALARQRLQALGITRIYGNDGSTPWCTVRNPSRFFSHRRDRVSGRLAACIWRV
jgi:hypothetical protein